MARFSDAWWESQVVHNVQIPDSPPTSSDEEEDEEPAALEGSVVKRTDLSCSVIGGRLSLGPRESIEAMFRARSSRVGQLVGGTRTRSRRKARPELGMVSMVSPNRSPFPLLGKVHIVDEDREVTVEHETESRLNSSEGDSESSEDSEDEDAAGPAVAHPRWVPSAAALGPRCPTCGEGSRDNLELENHLVGHHMHLFRASLPSAAPFLCPICDRQQKDEQVLARHFAFAHGMIYKLTDLTQEEMIASQRGLLIRVAINAAPNGKEGTDKSKNNKEKEKTVTRDANQNIIEVEKEKIGCTKVEHHSERKCVDVTGKKAKLVFVNDFDVSDMTDLPLQKAAESAGLPAGWSRRKVTRTSGVSDFYLRTPGGMTIRSQRQLDIFTEEQGMDKLNLKEGTKEAAKEEKGRTKKTTEKRRTEGTRKTRVTMK